MHDRFQVLLELVHRLIRAVMRRLMRLRERIKADIDAVYLLRTRRSENAFVILDDLFPWLGTGFRVREFNEYLRTFEKSVVYSTNPRFGDEMESYRHRFPEYANQIFRFQSERRFECRIVYIVFLHNAISFLPVIERFKLPFVLELYPGGHFRLNDSASDEKLRRVCNSPFLKKIIVTQPVTMKYLLERQLCAEQTVHYIYGGVVNIPETPLPAKSFCPHKKTFDICFTAYRQMPLGEDKGYDLFIEVAKKLSTVDTQFRFHVAGTFDEKDIDCSCLGEKIHFYGPQTFDFFPSYYQDKDLILAPNRPFVLANGAFDGIPTGSVVEAGACGVAMFCTDQLSLTKGVFETGKDIVIVNADVDSICEQIMSYVGRPEALYEVARRGKITIEKVFSPRLQLAARMELLREIMGTIPVR